MAHEGLSRAPEVHQVTAGHFENKASSIIERSALCPLQCTHHTKQELSSDYLFSDLRAISFLLFVLLSIFL